MLYFYYFRKFFLKRIYPGGFKMKLRIASIIMTVALCIAFAVPFFAAEDYRGDIDYSGNIELSDALALFKHVAGIKNIDADESLDITAADIDGNGLINLRDCLWLFKNIALNEPFPEYTPAE